MNDTCGVAMSKEPKLFGENKYEVESAARTLREAEELAKANTPIYQAAIKHLKSQQTSIGAVIGKALARKRG
jgi:hypothetical protein